jgi:hypothetical protein
MTRPIGFSAFLKLLELSETARRSELKKKLGGGGGFQYWRPVQLAAAKALASRTDVEQLKLQIDGMCSGHQREYNKRALVAFCNWISGKAISPIENLPNIDVAFGNSGLVIRIKPEVAFELDGERFSMNLWATTRPTLTLNTLSIGLAFCANAYRARGHDGYAHLVFDTVGNRLFREADIVSNALHLLKDKVDAFKRDWSALNPLAPGSPDGPSDRPPLPDQPR